MDIFTTCIELVDNKIFLKIIRIVIYATSDQCFPRLLPTGGFWSWKFGVDPVAGNGAVRLIGALKFKLAVGGFIDEPIAMLVADGTGVELSQTATIYLHHYY